MNMKRLAVGMGATTEVAEALDAACARWGIVAPYDQARFIAQLHVESNGFRSTEERLSYRPERLLEVFRGRNGLATLAQAKSICAGGSQAVANFVYGGEWGARHLGNVKEGDGWKYRGRGYIQLTGRDNYQKTSMESYGDYRLAINPDLLLRPLAAADSAAFFWYRKRLNGITNIRELTRKINGGTMHLPERIAKTQQAVALVESDAGR